MTDVAGAAPALSAVPSPQPAPAGVEPSTLLSAAVAPELPPAPSDASPAELMYPEVKPPVDPAASAEPKPEGDAPPALTPESYKDLKFRDGMSPSETRLKSFTELAAKAGLNPEDAQALVDLQQDIATEQSEAFRTAQEADFRKVQDQWKGEAMDLPWIKANPQVDPKAPDYNQGLAAVGVLFDEFDKTGQFRAMLNQTGTGNHPATLQFLYDVVQTLVEGSPVSPGKAIPSGPKGLSPGRTPAQIMFPDTSE